MYNPFRPIDEKLGRISAENDSRWVEGVYGDSAWTSADAPATSDFIGLAGSRMRFSLFFALAFAVVFTLLGRTGYLMAQSGSFKARSDRNRIRTIAVPAPRGVIMDRNGVQLTDNVSDMQLALVPADLPKEEAERKEAIGKLAKLAGVDPAAAEAAIAEYPAKSFEPVTVAERVTRDQAIQITIAKGDYPAARLVPGSHRFYSKSNDTPSLSHLLGYMGRIRSGDIKSVQGGNYQPTDSIGRTGLEYVYESELRGTPGAKKIEVDAMGNEVGAVGETDPSAGLNLRLSIDLELTQAVETALKNMLAKTREKKAAAIVEDVKTGEILALVSLPGYSDNLFAQGISSAGYKALSSDPSQPLFNRSISGQYPPGSTAKLMVAAGALQEGIITPSTSVESVGGIRYGQWWFPDWKAGGHGITDVKKAIAWSVNTFFYMIGGGYDSFVGMGIDRLDKYYRLFGVGEKLGIDLPNEAAGLVPTPQWKKERTGTQWYIGDTYHVSIGQGDLLATPLQMVSWTAAIANGGTLWRPHLAQAFLDEKGKAVKTVAPEAIRTGVVDEKYLKTVRAGMRDTVLSGSAQSLKINPMNIAGKTGTAQYAGDDAHAWFTSFAPYEDPQIAVTVLFEKGVEGTSTSVPVAGEIYSWYAANRMEK